MNGKSILSATLRLLGLVWMTVGIGMIGLRIFYAAARHAVDFSDREAVSEFTSWLGMLLIVTAPGLGFWLAGQSMNKEDTGASSIGAPPTSTQPARYVSSRHVVSGVLWALLMGFAGLVIAFWLLPMYGVILSLTANWLATAVLAALGSICGLLVSRR